MKKKEIDENLALIQGTLEQWLGFKRYLKLAFSEDEITEEDETNFLEIKSSIARNIRTLSERLKEMGPVDYGEKIMRDLLNRCVSVRNLRTLPPSDRQKLRKAWHEASILLSKNVGAFKYMSEGFIPGAFRRKKKRRGTQKTKKAVTVAVVIVILAAVGGLAYLQLS